MQGFKQFAVLNFSSILSKCLINGFDAKLLIDTYLTDAPHHSLNKNRAHKIRLKLSLKVLLTKVPELNLELNSKVIARDYCCLFERILLLNL